MIYRCIGATAANLTAALILTLGGTAIPSGGALPATFPPQLTGSAGVNRAEQAGKPYLILVSFDGFRADYLDRFPLPNFQRVIRRGVRAAGMRPVFPSLTFPNHYSLVTGLYAEHHGIVGNTFFDPRRNAIYSFRDPRTVGDGSWYGGEPIWVTAEAQGMVSACFFWPGSEAAIKGVRPTLWRTYDGAIPNQTRVETVLGWLRLPAERRPHLITLYFSELDSVSHAGPLGRPSIAAAAESLDRSLGALLKGIEALPERDRIYLLLTSDHGMVETSATRTVLIDSLVDTATVQVGFTGPIASLHVRGGDEPARRVRDQVNARLEHGRAYLRRDLPEHYHYRADPRAGDVVIVMDESWTIASSVAAKLRVWESWGQHGWDPGLKSMLAIFAISGPGIHEGATIPEVDNVDVYPLMTALLGLRAPEGLDGRMGHLRRLVSK